ncbi:MAG: DUF4350 domain-containing protein [Lewinella sp.]|jgi:hypothetical protein|uniref:DUF4350 domain-containing protein n=1 Tax=Lewinella sp. TaxID=2004506 RepID=UPI003D6A3D67
MKKNRVILGLIVLAVVLLAVWAIQGGGQRFSWRETFKIKSKEPYGLYALYDLFKDYPAVKELNTLADSLAGKLPIDSINGSRANYVFIGEGLYMRPQDRDELLEFVEAGNTAFLAAKVLPYDLMFYLYYDECDYIPWDGLSTHTDSVVQLNFTHPSLHRDRDFSFKYINKFAATQRQWQYFPDLYFCEMEGGMEAVGRAADTTVNMVRVPYGNGFFYLHSQPLVFTNYYLVKKEGRSYAERAFSHLNDGAIYWDEFSRIPERMAREQNNAYRSDPRRLQSESPLQYILEQPPLAWAWYTLVAIGLIFLLFRTRRRQRVIPVVHPPRNTSLQFVQTIGWLYYQRASHQQLAVQAIKLLRTYVKERYALQWRNDNEQFVQQLSARSGVDPDLVALIAKDVHNIPRYTALVETELVKFHQRLERFYQAAK